MLTYASELSKDEANERKIMKLLLKVKNGTPPMRKQALRQVLYFHALLVHEYKY